MKKLMMYTGIIILLLTSGFSGTAAAEFRLSKAFTDHMVLQRDRAVKIWGWADPGDKITVSFNGQSVYTVANREGKWGVKLAPMKMNAESQELRVSSISTGNDQQATIIVKDVVVGDVWLCTGQSNMAFSLGGCDAPEDIQNADYPNIRYRSYFECFSGTPQEDVAGGEWQRITPQTAAGCTAVGFYFGRKLYQETKVPIGLLECTVGGTEIECWMPPRAFEEYPACAGIGEQLQKAIEEYKQGLPAAIDAMEKWIPEAKKALTQKKELPPAPRIPLHPNEDRGGRWVRIQSLYNGMVHPFVNYTIKGAIWYQGESNGAEEQTYVDKLTALIGSWRKLWGYEFPFYYVQIANWQQPIDDPSGGNPSWQNNRMAMVKCLAIPKTGMAVTIDVGDAADIHPKNKYDVGERLALWALAKDYGYKNLVYSGPLYKGMTVEGDKIRLQFDSVGSGLMIGKKDGREPVVENKEATLKQFAIAGADRQWHWADAVIDGKTVVVSSPAAPEPVAVRYAFQINPVGANVYNKEGLPASPFRTDEW